MNKYNREFDETKINQAKQRSIIQVLETIEPKRSIFSIFKRTNVRYALSFMAVVLVVVLGFTFFNKPDVVGPNQRIPTASELSDFERQKLVETSYISGNIIINSLGNSLQQLALVNDTTKFDSKADEFNYYFNMLKPFIDDEDFSDFQVTELSGSEYQLEINYFVGQKNYSFRLSVDDSIISGELETNDITLLVSGEIYKSDEEIDLELLASSGDDYIKVEYNSEIETDESEKTYEIEQFINGVFLEKEVKIYFEADEIKVEIEEGDNEYLLEKIIEGESYYYYLEYEIDGVEGEVYITEELVGNEYIYNYHIEEEGVEKDLELDDYDDDDEDDEDEEDEEEDEEDEEEDEEDEEDEDDDLDEEDEEDEEDDEEDKDEEDEEDEETTDEE
ncbi:MAG: hypothetical protein R6U15_05555 [Candidatus Izemoplasmatales bacterium]